MQLSAQTIAKLSDGSHEPPLIEPFRYKYVHSVGLSGGLTCAGYDVHLADCIDVNGATGERVFDHGLSTVRRGGDIVYIIPARTGVLGVTKEKFNVPADMCMQYFNKSTLARWFINAAATLAEPGWSGHLTLEIMNDTDKAVELIKGQPIGQVVFNRLDERTVSAYNGKYQKQEAKPVQGRKE